MRTIILLPLITFNRIDKTGGPILASRIKTQRCCECQSLLNFTIYKTERTSPVTYEQAIAGCRVASGAIERGVILYEKVGQERRR